MLPHPLTYLEIQVCYQSELRFNGVYLHDNLPDKVKDGTYVIHLDEYDNIGTDWIALYVIGNAMTVLQSNTFEKQSKSSSMDLGFSNLWILLYWIY